MISVRNKGFARYKTYIIIIFWAVLATAVGLVIIMNMRNRSADNRLATCGTVRPVHEGLADARSPQLQRLAQYEDVCDGAIADRLSFFVTTPTTVSEARQNGRDIAMQLHEFHDFSISPVVFFEPTSRLGLVDMKQYGAGEYDDALDALFATIRSEGVTDEMMGTWVPIPEGNLPMWSSVEPADFSACVKKAVTYQKKYFPASSASIMLDTDTYPQSRRWTDGRAVSLVPYLQGIPTGMIDSFGLQGLPWSAPAGEEAASNGTPEQYLRTDFAVEAAKVLGIKDIWINTGTYGVKYANQPGRTVTMSLEQRAAQLRSIVDAVMALQAQDYNVAVHLFAEDKSTVSEATDWSYWPNGKAASSSSTSVFTTFVRDLRAADIPLWLYDGS